ncbi:MAG TPA: MFS transporter [Anaeromyxobacteraceae bacterium]|nr:MFS transporter [Anaeromyxobacteraceae bacterium]
MSAPASTAAPAATLPAPRALRGDAEVVSLVAFAHATSHFFQLLFPPLFPWLMSAFGLSFTRAGALMTAFYVTSGVGQAAAGFAVDRIGARRVLQGGMALFSAAALALATARGYPQLLAAAVLAGLGNSVLHPADFTLLNRRVSHARLGPAFSAHALSGSVGWAAAPAFMTGIAAVAGWRAAALGAAIVPLAPLALLGLRRATLADGPSLPGPASAPPAGARGSGAFAFLAVSAVWMCFLFFLVSTMAFGALQNFAAPVFQASYGLSLAAATSALTFYLLGSAGGIVVGGVLAARRSEHDRLIAIALLAAAATALAVAVGSVPPWTVLPAMAVIGFCTGAASPSRDLLVRRAAMARFGAGSFGRVYGFVYSGLDLGLSLAPLFFGGLMDRGLHRPVLMGVAALQTLAVLAALRVGRQAPGPAPAGR